MTLEQCYAQMGADYAAVLKRFYDPDMICRFVKRFPSDPSFGQLKAAMAAGDVKEAFRAAHTLKGVAQNLGFQRLYLSSAALTEALRGPKPLTDPALREAVAMDQAALLTAIQELEG